MYILENSNILVWCPNYFHWLMLLTSRACRSSAFVSWWSVVSSPVNGSPTCGWYPRMPDDSVDLYLSAKSFRLDARIAFIPDVAGRVALRVVDDAAWHLIPKGELAPRNAVALELLESGDPRHWIGGEHLVDSGG
jgi:hypothetical protein